jgi:transcription termination factor Rho
VGSSPASRIVPPPSPPARIAVPLTLRVDTPVDIAELRRMPMPALLAMADELEIPATGDLSKPDLILRLGRALLRRGETLRVSGTLEVMKQGNAFVRSADASYLAEPDDASLSPAQVKRFGLRTGDVVVGEVRSSKPWERFLAVARLESVNGRPVEEALSRGQFDALRPQYPDERLRLETADGALPMRVVDLFAPIGKGQRGLIVAPPRAGKTVLLQQMANAIAENHPEVVLIILLLDERPEEVTGMREAVPSAEVVSSTFDEKPARHVAVAAMVEEKAKRLVESGRDVVILLDSITRLARAHNAVAPSKGRILSGGVEAGALDKPKRFFGAARKIAGGGSLTIIGTALVDTGSRMDEVIFEEFKGTGNMELVLDRDLANRRIFPAIDLFKSGTRKEELLLTQEEMNRALLLRTFLSGMGEDESLPFLLRQMAGSRSNREFFRRMAEGG